MLFFFSNNIITFSLTSRKGQHKFRGFQKIKVIFGSKKNTKKKFLKNDFFLCLIVLWKIEKKLNIIKINFKVI